MNDVPVRPRAETWSGGGTLLAQSLARPLARFLAQEAASGVLLVVATVAALIWANSAWSDGYHDLWATEVEIALGSWHPFQHGGHSLTLQEWVNDALMAVFFFVVGLEITTEVVNGELRNPRIAMLPTVAAVGGMVVPALLFLAVAGGGDGAGGWGIPMATDIAFAVGVLTLLGPRVPRQLKVFVLTLAIVDDIGAILVIAFFYSDGLSFAWLGVAVAGLVSIGLMRRLRIWYTPVYILVGAVVWYATFRSGVHSTIAGVAVGVLTPARPLLGTRRFEALEDIVAGDVVEPKGLRDASWRIREMMSVSARLIAIISPWTSFVIVPLFAFANAGVTMSVGDVTDALTSDVTLGIVVGLVVGKPVGIVLGAWGAARYGPAEFPPGVTLRHVAGAGAVAGIGFTVALFVTRLAFADELLVSRAVVGVLLASLLASIVGALVLATAKPSDDEAGAQVGAGAERTSG